jgi:glucose-1-phosphate thymidylyltransferase
MAFDEPMEVQMKGVVLAGGSGSRLHPLTSVTNKHLLPIYNKPMVYYPLQTLVDAGIRDILLVTGGDSAGDFPRLLRNGKEFGLQRLHFAYQEGEERIADALRLAEPFAAGEKICVILGDNILETSIRKARENFEHQGEGARILLKEVPDPERFGVPILEQGRVTKIEEKPKVPCSSYAVIGVYFYDATVFDRVRSLRTSGRGEFEITDVNNSYIRERRMEHEIIEGGWTEAGTFESLWRATKMVREKVLLAEEQRLIAASARKAARASSGPIESNSQNPHLIA